MWRHVVTLPGGSQVLCSSATQTTSAAVSHAVRQGSHDQTDVLLRTCFWADLTLRRLSLLDEASEKYLLAIGEERIDTITQKLEQEQRQNEAGFVG